MLNRSWKPLLLCVAMLTVCGGVAVAEPSTQPSATTKPAGDLPTAKAIISGLGGMWTSVHEAMEKKDYATAEQVSGKMLEQRQAMADAARGTPIERLAAMGFDQLDTFHKALADKQDDKARSLMSGLDEMGRATMKILNPDE